MTTRTEESDRILAQLQELRRGPFREALAECMGNRPSNEAWSALAEKQPDRWAQGLSILAKASGFRDQIEVDADVSIGRKIDEMSDMEMTRRIEELHAERALKPAMKPSAIAPEPQQDEATASMTAPAVE